MRRITITGCSRGLGHAMAEAFSTAGHHVAAHARTAGPGIAVAGDLRDVDLGVRLAATEPDVLVLNAGVLGPMAPLLATDFDAFRDVMEVNVAAQLRVVVACLPGLVARRGTLIWLTSYLGRFGLPGYGGYCASKHALEGLMKLVAAEHPEVISVAVSPGMTETDMLQAAIGPHEPTSFKSAATAAAQFVRLVDLLEPAHSGQSLEIDAIVPTPDAGR